MGRFAFFLAFLFQASFAFAESTRLNTDGLLELIKQNDVKSIEGLIPLLPVENRSHYALIYRSLSPQHASFENPRVVAFDPTAELIIAFNNDPSFLSSYLTLDILDFDEKKGVYAGHALHFDQSAKTAPVLEKNAPLCLQCHPAFLGVEPINRAYLGGVFPGIFGSMADLFGSPLEQSAFEKFVAQQKNQGRYSALLEPNLNAQSKGRVDRPNAEIGFLLNHNTHLGLARYLVGRPELKPFRYAILASLECSSHGDWDSDLEHYLPAKIRENFKFNLNKIKKEAIDLRVGRLDASLRQRDFYLEESSQKVSEISLQDDERDAAPAFRYLISQAAPGAAPLLNEIQQIVLDGSDQQGGISNLAEPLYPLWLDSKNDAELLALHEQYDHSRKTRLSQFKISERFGSQVCRELKSKSLLALGGGSL